MGKKGELKKCDFTFHFTKYWSFCDGSEIFKSKTNALKNRTYIPGISMELYTCIIISL